MIIEFVQGDLIDLFQKDRFNVIAHQCNKTIGHGAGIARKLDKEFGLPNYVKTSNSNMSSYYIGVKHTTFGDIVNIYSQDKGGSPVDIEEHRERLKSLRIGLNFIDEKYKGKHLAIPLIASGIAKYYRLPHTSDLDYFRRHILYVLLEELHLIEKLTIVYL